MINFKDKRANLHYLLIVIFLVSGTISGCSNLFTAKKQSLNIAYGVRINDPLLKQLADITKQIDIDAAGEFKAGNYVINGFPVVVSENTLFKLKLSLPISDANIIDIGAMKGELWTSHPIHSHGVLIPQMIVLDQGKISGEIDFVRILGSFVVNVLKEQMPADAGGVKALIQNLTIKSAIFNLRPDSTFVQGEKVFHIGEDSRIELNNLVLDGNYNYIGQCKLDVNLLAGSKWIGKKIDCSFENGKAHLLLELTRNGDGLSCLLCPKISQKIVLQKSLFQFGKFKRCSALCQNAEIDLRQFVWHKYINKDDAEMEAFADLKLVKTQLIVKTDTHQTTAYFPGANPANLQISINDNTREIRFRTLGNALAQNAIIEIFKPTSRLKLSLAQVLVSPIVFDKSGQMNLQFAKGVAKLQELDWSNGKRNLRLISGGSADLAVPKGLNLVLDRDSGLKMSLPLRIKMGSATIEGSIGQIILGALDGNILIDIDKEVILLGDIAFVLRESKFLGSHEIAVKVQRFKFAPSQGGAVLHLSKCLVIIPNQCLKDAVQDQLPNEKHLDIDKTIFADRRWRYKNAQIKTVNLNKLNLDKVTAEGTNSVNLAVSGDVIIRGTVEKTSVMSMLIKGPDKYESKDWQINAHCLGNGKFAFDYLPKGSLSKSKVPYTLSVNLPIPDDMHLDWSRVEHGLYKGLEHGIIVSMLKKMGTVKLAYKGLQPLFNSNRSQLDAIKLSNLVTRAVPGGMQVDFTADATF